MEFLVDNHDLLVQVLFSVSYFDIYHILFIIGIGVKLQRQLLLLISRQFIGATLEIYSEAAVGAEGGNVSRYIMPM